MNRVRCYQGDDDLQRPTASVSVRGSAGLKFSVNFIGHLNIDDTSVDDLCVCVSWVSYSQTCQGQVQMTAL